MTIRRFLAIIVVVLTSCPAHAGDWTNWRGPTRTGYSPEKGLPAEWKPAWTAPYGSRSTPIVMNGRVYFINYASEKTKGANGQISDVPESIQERVMCLDADTGALKWEHKFNVWHTDIVTVRLGWTNVAGDPVTGNVYATGTQGLFFCFDKDGKVLWQKSLTEEYGRITGYGGRISSPVVDEDLVIFGMLNSSWGDQGKGGGRWLAMDKRTGKVAWWSEPGATPKDTYYSVPVIATIGGQRLLISGGPDGGVHAMKVRTGEHVWSYYFGTAAVNPSPVVDGNLIYIAHGEEIAGSNIQGRIICVDGSQVEKKTPKLVWQRDGITVRYASPIVHDGKLFVCDEIARLYCLDAATGKNLWKKPFTYGTDSRASPVLADGKIYVGEVTGKFHILAPGATKCVKVASEFFPSPDGFSGVELNGSAAVANGRVYVSTSDATYCLGEARKPEKAPPNARVEVGAGKPSHLQIFPADTVLHPGESVALKAHLFDEKGNFLREVKAEWSLPTPPLPPGAKTPPPALKGQVADGKLSADAKVPAQQGYVAATAEGLTAKGRVRVAPVLPYSQDFTKVPAGAVPGGWVNTQGKFLVGVDKNDEPVLRKVTNKPSPLVSRGNAFMGMPSLTDYTIEADVTGTQVGPDLPDVGVVANRYTLMLQGNIQKLRIVSWDAVPRIDETVNFKWQPGVWYRLKLTVEVQGKQAIIKGKAWPRDQKEPESWVQVNDSYPNREGSPALYAYVTGNLQGAPGTDVFFDNVRITPNKK